jgi:hypothetical protein
LPDQLVQPIESTANEEEILSSKEFVHSDSIEAKQLSEVEEALPIVENVTKESSVEEIYVEQVNFCALIEIY